MNQAYKQIALGLILSILPQNCVSTFPDITTSITINEDIATTLVCEQGLESLLQFSREKAEPWGLVPGGQIPILEREEKDALLNTWGSLLDYLAQLDHIQQKYASAFLKEDRSSNREAMHCFYLAFVTQYRYALEFLDLVENNENIHTFLNEAYPQYGLEANLYRQFKFHFLNVFLATKFVALDAIMEETAVPENFEYLSKIETSEAYLYEMGQGSGTAMTFENGWTLMQEAAFEFWLPLQKGVSSFMGGKKVWRLGESLMTIKEIQEIEPQLEPGDIIFTRKEWALTNLGLPGFWTHTALYIATPEQRETYFADDETNTWIMEQYGMEGNFEDLLDSLYGSLYQKSCSLSVDGNPYKVIEALKPGVILNSLETTLTCDGVAVLRPNLPRQVKARAISYAFASYGKPYDLNFDFRTDSALVCSELVLKAYEPIHGENGLNIKTTRIGQRVVTPCNVIVQEFSEAYGTPDQQLEYVLFYDGFEKKHQVVKSNVDELLMSWKRPDWHIFLQE